MNLDVPAPVSHQPDKSDRLGDRLNHAVENLAPGYFALVMGTGIVSVGLHRVGVEWLSRALLVVAAVAYVILWVLYIWRAISFREAMLHDLRSPKVAFSYFTVVAATDVLAVRLVGADMGSIAVPLVLFAGVLWFIFGYTLPWQVFMTRDGKPILARTNGTWFIWSVASQSLAVGIAEIQPYITTGRRVIGILAVLSWSVGVALYAAVAILVLLRIIYFGITPKEFTPPFWVVMGALAIAVVAGTNIVNMESTPMVDATRGLIAGTVVVFWSIGVWLIPMLVGAGVWRHFVHKVPLRYQPALWSMVFPVGMIAVASVNIGRIDDLPVVEFLGEIAVYVSAVVWVIVFAGLLSRIMRLVFAENSSEQAS